MTDAMVGHFDACLGCMACVTACPSGVQYDTLIEQTRAQVERRHDALARPTGPAGADLRALPPPAAAAAAARPAARAAGHRAGPRGAPHRPARAARAAAGRDGEPRAAAGQPQPLPDAHRRRRATRRGVVGLLTGCVQGAFFPGVNAATARVLRAEGCDVVVPDRAGLLRGAVGAQRPRGRGPGLRPARWSTPSTPPASSTSS